MKPLRSVVALVFIVILIACNKTDRNHLNTIAVDQNGAAATQKVFASPWQTLAGWHKDSGGFHSTRQPLPIKPKGGKVLLFARNVWAADSTMKEPMEDITLQLPFNFLPYTNQPGLTETWQYEVLDNELKIDLKVDGGEMVPRPVQVRCLYIPDSVWQNLKQSTNDELAYESLVSKLKIQP